MYPNVEQFETRQRRVALELQLLAELREARRATRRRRRAFALRAPGSRTVAEAGCVAGPKCG